MTNMPFTFVNKDISHLFRIALAVPVFCRGLGIFFPMKSKKIGGMKIFDAPGV